jgi:hypothetical protein
MQDGWIAPAWACCVLDMHWLLGGLGAPWTGAWLVAEQQLLLLLLLLLLGLLLR